MQHVVHPDFAALEQDGFSPWLVGRPGANDSCAVRIARANIPIVNGLHSCAVDRLLFILSGALGLQIGLETYYAPERALVLVPAGAPHAVFSTAADGARFLEIFTPCPPSTLLRPAAARKVENAASLIRPLLAENFSGGGFAYQSLAERKTGSDHVRVNIVEVQPGSGSPDFHIHAFDQFYFILDGQMQVEIGRKTHQAPANSLIHLPAGIVHRNYNLGPEIETHVTLIVPEPCVGEIFDYAVDIHNREAVMMASAPGFNGKA